MFLRLTRNKETGTLKLALCSESTGQETASVSCVSGQSYAQHFRTGTDPKSVSGSGEPIPEGQYWAALPTWKQKGNWDALYSASIGPVWIGLRKFNVGQSKRDNFGIVYGAEGGTAGSIKVKTKDEMREVLSWFEKYPPAFLVVDWELGTVELPKPKPPQPPKEREKPRMEQPEKKPEETSTALKLPWYLIPFKGMILKAAKWAIAALLAMLAGHLPVIAPYVDKIAETIALFVEKLVG